MKHGILGTSLSVLNKRNKEAKAAAISPQLEGRQKLNGSYPCPHCPFTAKWKGGLRYHLNKKHPDANQNPEPRKETQLAKRSKKTTVILPNGHAPQGEDHSNANGIPDVLIALTGGRFLELCRQVASEHYIPERMFTARVSAFIHAAQIR
jgi:hypothetical protein